VRPTADDNRKPTKITPHVTSTMRAKRREAFNGRIMISNY